jgi:hypothetical protein
MLKQPLVLGYLVASFWPEMVDFSTVKDIRIV